MASDDKKRYFWLKLHKDFFKRHEIVIIEDMENGKDYILFYLKLLLESVAHEGKLRWSDTIPYNEKMLASLTNTNIDIVRSAMKVFIELEMIEILDDKTIFMLDTQNLIGSETGYTIRQRLNRDRKGQVSIGCQLGVNDTKRLEIRDKSIEKKEKDIFVKENKESKETSKKENKKIFKKPTLEEVKTYCEEKGLSVDAAYFIDYYEAVDWKVGKNPMKDWKATVRNWARNNKNWGNKNSKTPDYTIEKTDYKSTSKGLSYEEAQRIIAEQEKDNA